MEPDSTDLKKLFLEKKYSEIIKIIETKIREKDKSSGLLNLLGVCKFLNNSSEETLNSSKNDFRKAYLKEKNTPNAFHALKNFINISMDLFDLEFRSGKTSSEKVFEEIFLYFNENKNYFEKNEGHAQSIIRVFKRNLDLENVIYYLKKVIDINGNNIDAICAYIYFNSFRKDWDQKKFFEYSIILNRKLPLLPTSQLIDFKINKKKKINLAFFSADIRSKHSVTYFLRTVLMNYDKERFNVFLYLNNEKEDQTVNEFKNYVFKTTNIFNLKDVEAINVIRSDEIDIIIDLMGITSNHRLSLFKNRLAKKQILWCGYNNTSGIDQMDYLIADKKSIYKDEEHFYSEKILYLDDIWNCHSGFPYKREFNEAPISHKKYVTFGSFNNFRKINDDVINIWSSILKKVSNAKLVLKPSDTASFSKISEKFYRNGVLDSIIFLSHKKSFEEHLNDYKKIDIALDTFPYNGVTTSFEAIWMGVPVLTMKGNNFNSRGGESINKNLDLDELICRSDNDYIKKAVSISENINKIISLRKIIFDNALKSPLFDKKKFSKNFYDSLENIYN